MLGVQTEGKNLVWSFFFEILNQGILKLQQSQPKQSHNKCALNNQK